MREGSEDEPRFFASETMDSRPAGSPGRDFWMVDARARHGRCPDTVDADRHSRGRLMLNGRQVCDSATEWRQDVAMGVSPWNTLNHCDSVPKGRQDRVMRSSGRPFRTFRASLSQTTCSRPWLQNAVPLGLNRSVISVRQKYAVTTKQILPERRCRCQ